MLKHSTFVRFILIEEDDEEGIELQNSVTIFCILLQKFVTRK